MTQAYPTTGRPQVHWATLLATAFCAFIALAHAARLLFQVRVVVANIDVPLWVSVVGILGPGVLAILLWRECRR